MLLSAIDQDVGALERQAREEKKRKRAEAVDPYAEWRPIVSTADTIFKNYIDSLPEVVHKDHKHFQQTLQHVWANIMCDFFHIYDVPTTAVQCTDACLLHKTIMRISDKHHVYGCWRHGYLHTCEADWGTCDVRHIGEDLSVVCALSGRSMGFVQGDDCTYRGKNNTQSRSTRKMLFDYYQSLRRFDEQRGAGQNRLTSTAHKINTFIDGGDAAAEAEKKRKIHSPKAKEVLDQRILDLMKKVDKEKELERAQRDDSVARPPSDNSTESSVTRPATEEEIQQHEYKQKQEKMRTKLQRKQLIYSSPQVAALTKQAEQVGLQMMRVVIGEVIEHILYDSEVRALYNQFMRGCTLRKAHEAVRLEYQNMCRKRLLLPLPTALNILDHYNDEYKDCIVSVQRDVARTEQIIRRITRLWVMCARSPFVDTHKRRDELNDVINVSPTAEDMCSLRQFALTCLYDMRDGYGVTVQETAQRVQIVPADAALVFMLPPEEHVNFFGPYAKKELQLQIRNANFIESQFDAARTLRKEVKPIERAKTRRTSRANSVKSVSLARSESIESSLTNIVRDRKKKRTSRARATYDDYVQGERNVAMNSGRVRIGNSLSGTTSVTEHQRTPFYMREPMLTVGTKNSGRHYYCVQDLSRGRKFRSVALQSYGESLMHVLS